MSNEKSPRIIGILATKDRPNFFKRALASAANQKRRLDAVIVVSDSSEDNYRLEKQIAEERGFEIVRDTREHNYAGSLNSAIHHYVRSRHWTVGEFAETYVAFLDDDDEWLPQYIEKCEAALRQNNADFVVCGLRYKDEHGARDLSIPQELAIEDFLRGNPHIQGSNTFINLSVLMGAGLFDENMNSTTDRDLFVRVMMQNPTYAIVKEHLVEIDASSGRKRITNSREIKIDGLRKFYYKYRALMDEKTRSDFFKRAADRFGADEEEITKIAEKRLSVGERFSNKRFEGRLVAGFIATETELGMRLLRALAALDVAKLKVVILYNAASGFENYEAFLRSNEIDFVLRKSSDISFDDFRDVLEPDMAKSLGKEKIEDIAVSRSILQKLLWQNSKDGDVIWILDDDMELCELVAKDGKIEEVPLDVGRVIATYGGGEYDAVVGRYSLDAPLPVLSTLRCSLLDLAYSRLGFEAQGELPPLETLSDCYYDLSDATSKHLETPFAMQEGIGLDEIFSGKTNRRLFVADSEVRDVKSRGGNTLVFNREILKVPNWSLKVKDKIARRGDFFWVLKAKACGFKIADVPFATKHNRGKTAFNFVKERGKLLRDLIGSSFTKAVEQVGMEAKCEAFHKVYRSKFEERLTKFVCSFFRIQALLKMLGDKKYLADFSCANLAYFVKLCKESMDRESVESAYREMCRALSMNENLQSVPGIQQKLAEYLGISEGNLRLLGNGGEAVVFTDKRFVYKCFFAPLQNKEFLKKISLNFGECKQLYPIELLSVSTLDVIKYRFEDSSPYEGGHARELAAFLHFAKENGFAFDNIKKSNFIVAGGNLKMIDYGKSFIPFEAEKFKTSSVMRAYQMFRYPTLSEDDFKRMIFRSYTDERTFLSDGWQNLDALVQKRHKEALHDDIVLALAQKHNPAKILDYGAGHCRIANALSLRPDRKVCVYDIDMETIQKRAGEKVSILSETSSLENGTFDLILNNLVLCCIDEETAESVMQEISRLLKLGGQAIFSICNPFFNSVQNTELRTTGLQGNYRIAERFIKKTTIGTPERVEFHRPIEFYENLFSRYGIEIESVLEGRGVNTDNLLPIAEHIIFDCKKVAEDRFLDDCSLMIKTNPMEYKTIYQNICHIVLQLEKGVRFFKRIVVADMTKCDSRARAYCDDNEKVLRSEIERAKNNRLIDEILYAEDDAFLRDECFKRYFDVSCESCHSKNGQGLFATLCGFDSIQTKYVLQTDSDILYHIEYGEIQKHIDLLKGGSISSTFSVYSRGDQITSGHRIEVRTCFLNLERLSSFLPLKNEVENGKLVSPWHRALDEKLRERDEISLSVRLHSSKSFFVHPQNTCKTTPNFLVNCQSMIEQNKAPAIQHDRVDLQGERHNWVSKTTAELVVYIRGFNTPCDKLKRLFDSLKAQTFSDFEVVYIDDASENEGADYARFMLKNDSFFKERTIAFFNDTKSGELANFVFAMQNVIVKPESIVVNVDNDDYLVNPRALEIIKERFDKGADLTCGNCIRYDNPLKKYELVSFDRVWERGGDNIWVHPKCFRRKLFDSIDVESDLKIDGKFVDVNTDFAIMLPMVDAAQTKEFISEVLYYFEPSADNANKVGKYSSEYKAKVKQELLENAKKKSHRDNRGREGRP